MKEICYKNYKGKDIKFCEDFKFNFTIYEVEGKYFETLRGAKIYITRMINKKGE